MDRRGMVVSDLHMLSRRSRGEQVMEEFLSDCGPFDIFVFNGDTFDFNWTDRPSVEIAIEQAVTYLQSFIERFPGVQIVYLLGNHDCISSFVRRLEELALNHPNFSWHSELYQLGGNLFLHGDACNALMTRNELSARRAHDATSERRSAFARWLYQYIILFGLNRIVYFIHSKQELIRRLRYYLESDNPPGLNGISHVFFGHTHVPFRHRHEQGIEFVNTGSAIRGLRSGFCEFGFEKERVSR